MKLRRFGVLAALIAVSIVLIVNLGHFRQFISLLDEAAWYILVLVLVSQSLSYYSNAKYYQSFLRLFGYKVKTKPLFEAALALNFVNQVFPSGGVSGASYLTAAFRDEIPTGKMTLAQLMRYVFTFISFMIILVVGLLLLFWGGNLRRITVRLTVLFIAVVIGLALIVARLIANRERMEMIATKLAGWLNMLMAKLFRRRKLVRREQITHFFDEFYEGYEFLMAEKGQWRRPLLFALAGNVAEVTTVYIVFLAFGQVVNPGIVIAGYALANILSIVSLVTGGIGLYEASMVGAFVALGMPFTVAFSVVIMYRVLNMAVFLPIGFHYYQRRVINE